MSENPKKSESKKPKMAQKLAVLGGVRKLAMGPRSESEGTMNVRNAHINIEEVNN